MKKYWFLIIVLLLFMAGYLFFYRLDPGTVTSEDFPYQKHPGPYPGTGYAPFAQWYPWDDDADPALLQRITLSYAGLLWREIEPEKGQYDFDALEEKYHLETIKNQGCRIVLRILADHPDSEESIDIPQWLYEEMDGAGSWYEHDGKNCFSPDYNHPSMKRAHKKMLEALARHYGQDFIAYVQLGTVGQYGEWHTSYGGQMPDPESQKTYIEHYRSVFMDQKLMMRRPFSANGYDFMGYYNDMLGTKDSTDMWLDWIRLGNQEENIPPRPEFWLHNSVGGEFSHGDPYTPLNPETIQETLREIQESHMSFIGPCAPLRPDTEAQLENAVEISDLLGYDVSLTHVVYPRILQKGKNNITLLFQNRAMASLFVGFQVHLYLTDSQGNVVLHQISAPEDNYGISPGDGSRHSVDLRIDDNLEQQEYRLTIALRDPLTGEQFPISSRSDDDGCFYVGAAQYFPQYTPFCRIKEKLLQIFPNPVD